MGEMSFKVSNIKVLKPRINRSCVLITGTPIVMRIPKEKYREYGMKSKYEYTYGLF